MRTFSALRVFRSLRAFALRTWAGAASGGGPAEDAALDGDVWLAPYLSGAVATGPALIGPVLVTAGLDGHSFASAALTGSITTQPS